MDEEQLIRIREQLARVEGKLDSSISGQDDHERRIRSLERFRYAVPSASLIVAVGTMYAAWHGHL